MRLTEGIIRDLKTFFEQNMPSKLTALQSAYEADYQDGIDLPVPAVYAFGRRGLNQSKAYPRIEFMAPDGGGMSVLRYGQNWTDAEHDVEIRVSLEGNDPGRLRLQLMRYAQAMWELFVERFFGTEPADYFALHGEGDITITYDGPSTESLATAAPYYDSATLSARVNKQEED